MPPWLEVGSAAAKLDDADGYSCLLANDGDPVRMTMYVPSSFDTWEKMSTRTSSATILMKVIDHRL